MGLRGPVLVLGVHEDAGCAVIERLHHLALIKRRPVPRLVAIAVAANGPDSLILLELFSCAEQTRIVGHIEHTQVFHRPRLDFLTR